MGQHLGTNKRSNALRRHLEERCIQPEACDSFEMIAYGPLFPEAQDQPVHNEQRDKVAALERELAETLTCVGYNVLNKVSSKKPLDSDLWVQVRKAFLVHFPEMA